MIREHVVNVIVRGKAEIDKLAKSQRDLDKANDDTSKSAGKAGKASKKMGISAKKAGLGLLAAAAAAKAAVDAWAKLEAAQGRLQNAFNNSGGTTADMSAALNLAAKSSEKYGIRTLDSINAMQKLADASGSAKTALSDYKLAVDIAAQANINLDQATNLVAKARKGEVEELKSLRGINKDLAQDLGKIEDETLRTEFAIQLLSESYTGAAEANAGLIDKQAAFKSQVEDLTAAAGGMLVTIGTEGAGLIGALAELLGIVENGDKFFEQLTTGLKNFSTAVGETAGEIGKLVKGFKGILEGKSIFEVISEQDTKSAKKSAEVREQQAEKVEKIEKRKEESVTKDLIQQELKRQEVVKKSVGRRAKSRKDEESAIKREQDQNLKDWEDWLQRRDNAELEAKDRAFREQMAQLKLQGQIRQAMEQELRKGGATEGEITIALGTFDEGTDKLQRERDLRDEIARLTFEGSELEAKRLAIMADADLTPFEKSIALKKVDEEQTEKIMNATMEWAGAMRSVAAGAIEAAGVSEGAKRALAVVDALIMGAQAAFMIATGNIPGGIAAAAAAIQMGAIGGAGDPVPSKGSGSSSPDTSNFRAADAVGMIRVAEPKDTAINVNVKTLSYVDPEDARRIGQAEARNATSIIGGRK